MLRKKFKKVISVVTFSIALAMSLSSSHCAYADCKTAYEQKINSILNNHVTAFIGETVGGMAFYAAVLETQFVATPVGFGIVFGTFGVTFIHMSLKEGRYDKALVLIGGSQQAQLTILGVRVNYERQSVLNHFSKKVLRHVKHEKSEVPELEARIQSILDEGNRQYVFCQNGKVWSLRQIKKYVIDQLKGSNSDEDSASTDEDT